MVVDEVQLQLVKRRTWFRPTGLFVKFVVAVFHNGVKDLQEINLEVIDLAQQVGQYRIFLRTQEVGVYFLTIHLLEFNWIIFAHSAVTLGDRSA